MKRSDRDYLLYLLDMATAMKRVLEYTHGLAFEHFCRDDKTVDAVIRNFEVIGEASKNIPTHIRINFPQIPWEEMYRLRNRISHEYFGIDYEIIWDIITHQLPTNLEHVEEVIRREKDTPERS